MAKDDAGFSVYVHRPGMELDTSNLPQVDLRSLRSEPVYEIIQEQKSNLELISQLGKKTDYTFSKTFDYPSTPFIQDDDLRFNIEYIIDPKSLKVEKSYYTTDTQYDKDGNIVSEKKLYKYEVYLTEESIESGRFVNAEIYKYHDTINLETIYRINPHRLSLDSDNPRPPQPLNLLQEGNTELSEYRFQISAYSYTHSDYLQFDQSKPGITVIGGPDNDYIRGTIGSDHLSGGEGDDIIWHGFDLDTGDDGSDYIIFNEDAENTLSGGPGNDRFIIPIRGNRDDLKNSITTIEDFEVGDFISSHNYTLSDSDSISAMPNGDGTETKKGGFEKEVHENYTNLHFGLDDAPGADKTIKLEGSYEGSVFLVGSHGIALQGGLFTESDDTVDFNTLDNPEDVREHNNALAGNDVVTLPNLDGVVFNGGDGNDTIRGGNLINNIKGGDGNDSLIGGNAVDRLEGGKDDDQLHGSRGNDLLFGGDGNDIVSGDEGNDRVNGGYGDDSLIGGAGDDRLDGGYGQDSIFGGGGKDTLLGGYKTSSTYADDEYSDLLNGGAGIDHYIAGWGDTVTTLEVGEKIELLGSSDAARLFIKESNGKLFLGTLTDDLLPDSTVEIQNGFDPGEVQASIGRQGEIIFTRLAPGESSEEFLGQDIIHDAASYFKNKIDEFSEQANIADLRSAAISGGIKSAEELADILIKDEHFKKLIPVLGNTLGLWQLIKTATDDLYHNAYNDPATRILAYESAVAGALGPAASIPFQVGTYFVTEFLKTTVDIVFGSINFLNLISGGGEVLLNSGDEQTSPLGEKFYIIPVDSEPVSFKGTGDGLDGANITGYRESDQIVLENKAVSRDQIRVTEGSAILDFDLNEDGEYDSTLTLEGTYDHGDFMAVQDAGNTVVTFETFLPELQEREAVSEDVVNGINNQEFLTGDGSTDFKLTLRDMGYAGYDNVVGAYEIDADGNIVDTRILYDNANADKSAQAVITDVEAGHRLGFFIVQDAADWAATLADTDTLSFVNGDGEGANLTDQADILLAVNGTATDEIIFHSFSETMNQDGLQHSLSGVDAGGKSITVGFEDLTGGGDRDYEDVVFRAETADEFMI